MDVLSKIVKNRKWKKSIEVCFFLVFSTLFDHISFNLSLCSNNIALNTLFICPFMFFETILDVLSKIVKNGKWRKNL